MPCRSKKSCFQARPQRCWRGLARGALTVSVLALLAACGGDEVGVGANSSAAPLPLAQRNAQSRPLVGSHLGANVPMINDYALTPVYVDLIHQARKYGSPNAPWDEKAVLGADGWPVGDFGVLLMIGAKRTLGNGGTYKLSFTGQAKVAGVSSRAQVSNLLYDAGRNQSSADVLMPDDEDQLMLAFTGTGTGVKNVKVIRPGYDALNPPLFTTAFIDHIARFKTLRFMDWLRTNVTTVGSWATRATPERNHYASSAGVPWEHIIALANQADKDIWINIPIDADDDYVVQLAQLLKTTLNPNSKIYVEYSNEIWNGGFRQFGVNNALALQEVQANPTSVLVYDGTTNPQVMAFRRVAKRLKEFSDIFRLVYGDAAMMDVVRPVLSGQVVQPLISDIGLKFIASVYGAPSHYFYAVAGAPYFNLGRQQTTEGLNADQVLQALGRSIEQLPQVNYFEANRALASWYGLKWLAYEAGPDTFGDGSLAAKKAANLDPRMRDLCINYLSTWYQNGGDMLMWFMAGAGNWDSRYGAWELTWDLAVTDTPKIACMDAVLGAPLPDMRARNEVPGTFNALAYVGSQLPYSDSAKSRLRYLHVGSFVDYLILAPRAGSYSLILNAEAGRRGNLIEVALNSQVIQPAFELLQTGWGRPGDNPAINVPLNQGFNTLRLTTKVENLGYSLSTLTFRSN